MQCACNSSGWIAEGGKAYLYNERLASNRGETEEWSIFAYCDTQG